MSSASFQIVYDGAALQGSQIDVRDLAPALLALGQVIEEANATFNAGQAKVSLKVQASFKSGCFGIDLSVVQGLLDQALGFVKSTPIVSAKELSEYLGFVFFSGVGVVKTIQWLKNRTIKEVIDLGDGTMKIVVDGDSLRVEAKVIALLRNYRLRLAIQQAVMEPLEREGFDTVAFTGDEGNAFITIEKSERGYFIAPPQDEEIIDERESIAHLQLVSVSFRDDNKWRFSDGSGTFFASIQDDDFLNRVRISEASFSAGDILKVRIKKRQWLIGDQMKSDAEIIEVMEHRRGMSQLRMPFSGGDSNPT